MKKIILLVLGILPMIAYAQKAQISFEATSHNFGTIAEQGGRVSHVFSFKNTGTLPLILTNVRAGCGCTTPEWSREPVAPGASGSIKVSFDPRNRPGMFTKSITVNSNASTPVVSLTIRGKVERKAAGPYDGYKESLGTIRLSQKNINFGAIKNTQEMIKSIEIIQSGDQPATIEIPSTNSTSVTVETATLAKNQKGNITIRYNPAKQNDWGFVAEKLPVSVNGQPVGELTVTATIGEDFSYYNGNYEKAPVITLSEKNAELTDLPKNSEQSHEFHIQNDGKSDLIIRKIKYSDNTVQVQLAKTTLKPGKKTKGTVTFKTGVSPQTTKIIQFTSNDPKNPIVTYKINCKTK